MHRYGTMETVEMEIREVRYGCIRYVGRRQKRCVKTEMAVLDKHNGIY